MLAQTLDRLLAQTALSVSDQQKQQLLAFVGLLDKWNKAYNLTSVRDPQEMLIKHILDSIVVSPYLQGERFIDVGTGPGLPGIPLAIMNPDKSFTLLDSLGKRIRFIRQVQHELGLTNIIPVQSRVEEFQPEQGFDGVLSRAFASLQDMVDWCHHLPAADQGLFYALKGVAPDTANDPLPAWCQIQQIIPLQVPELDAERHLVLIRKVQ
ncbi:16S rRNA (guanine(527)-N(7))-methyltransferase RsmG [Plesiomonas shigelloides]|uniref:16S rRNA (guanine(527)-N(7))-methyltransferase RsmG n=1 Tax=Plesiomonas shigelloides TaxID=703 RepID=UPI00126189E2|nr:16S rRNA (guanine(527)-N(7))-methyltransferase RsmG [Plesiomonas shigelloides]KAB7688429.1 16S rRNA (guanine(527)-N(7))-methyltransferase RsmG [Plesiomonas shigelloides]